MLKIKNKIMWDKTSLSFLKENFTKLSYGKISKHLGISESAVTRCCKKFNLIRTKEQQEYFKKDR